MTTKVIIFGIVWLAVATLAGATGAVGALRPPLPQIILMAITGAVLLTFWKAANFRAWALNVPAQVLLLPHASRWVGLYFLALQTRGELPYAFAMPAGWGDIIAASTGLALAFAPRGKPWYNKAWLSWNIFG